MSSDEQKIQEVIETWFEATRDGDLPKVLSLMTDDVVFLVAGRKPFGKHEFSEMSKGLVGLKLDGRVEVEELSVHGDWAIARTHITLDVKPHTGKAVRRSGYTLSAYQKGRNGEWLLARDANLLTTEQ